MKSRPVSALIGGLLFSAPSSLTVFLYEFFWWMHILLIFGFLNYLPYSKHLHVLSAIPNVFFANLDPIRNTLKPLNLDDESVESFGVVDIDQLFLEANS